MMNISSVQDLQPIFDVIPNPVFVKNRQHQIVLLNTAACELFGHSREVLLSFSAAELFPPEEVIVFNAADDRVFASGGEDENEEEVTDAAGKIRSVITRKRRITLGEEVFLVAVATDVTARRQAEAHNQYLAFHDTLTGLPNRALLSERIEQALLRAQRDFQSCVLMYIDLDRFKEVNDEHGHQAGDALIKDFAARLSKIVRASDTVARLGGDEFAILMPAAKDTLDAQEVSQRILAAASESFEVSGGKVFVGASIGMVLAPQEQIEQAELQRRADVALYQAKNEGRGCWRIFTNELDQGIRQRRLLEVEMREALATATGFEVHYQPLFATRGEEIVALEALVRWRHPRLGLLLPGAFISIAEQTGLIVPLGELVLKQAIAMIGRWPKLSIAVNLSPIQLRQCDLVERILGIVQEAGLEPARLQLEVTEGTILKVDETASRALTALRMAGVKIVLDDFGTGYSSLSHLQTMQVDKVKIDRSFVDQLGAAHDSAAIVHAVVTLCDKLGISVTAEGVETDAQRLFLRTSACTELQGYLFSKPLGEEEAIKYLNTAFRPGLAAA